MESAPYKKSIILSLLSGFLFALTFPPFDWDLVAWVALVPLLFAIDGQKPLRALLYGFICGMAFYLVGLSWIINTMVNFGSMPLPLSWLVLSLLAAYLSSYISIFCFFLQRMVKDNPVYLFLMAPLAWTCLEYARSSYPELGFSWLGLGYSQVDSLSVIQIAEFTGVYGVSAWIVLVNVGLFIILRSLYGDESIAKLRLPIGIVVLFISSIFLGYGFYDLSRTSNPDDQKVDVALIQGNIAQHLKWDRTYRDQVMSIYNRLTQETAKNKPDLIVWPEAVTPFYFSLDMERSEQVVDIVKNSGSPLLLGSPFLINEKGKPKLVNSAFLLSKEGEIEDRYDKIHLVPFGEFVPFEDLLWFVNKMATGVSDFRRGDEPKVFTLPLKGRKETKFGVSICFEIVFPELVRQPVKRGAQFLVNITNDAWFGKSAASYQHIDMAAMRAAENNVPIVRAANTGITGMIDANGRIMQATEIFVEEALLTTIHPSSTPLTFYSRYGDIFSFACIAGIIILSILFRRNSR
ncbi:MAG: apolipoprotein N-acyltransferase [Nitrospinales bacterium]